MYSLVQMETINFANLAIMGMDNSPHATWIFLKKMYAITVGFKRNRSGLFVG